MKTLKLTEGKMEEVLFFRQIKSKYPRAYEGYYKAIGVINKVSEYQRIRDLYDFFDGQRVYLKVWFEDKKLPTGFGVDVYTTGEIELVCKYASYTTVGSRIGAEMLGFEKAFEILNERLNNNQLQAKIVHTKSNNEKYKKESYEKTT